MSGIELNLRQSPAQGVRINLRGIIPSQLRSRTRSEIEQLPIQVDSQTNRLGDWFLVHGDSQAMELTISGQLDCCDYIGGGMDDGFLRVEGSVGDRIGYRMKAGELYIVGDAGRYSASQMRGGRITIAGNAGDYAGGAAHDERQGMRGGLLVIRGNVGMWAGHRMRRGTMIIHGSIEAGLAMRMIAGTIVCCGDVQPGIGCGMRRGTLVLLQEKLRRLEEWPGFTDLEDAELSFLPILLRSVIPDLPERFKQKLLVESSRLPRRGLRCLGDRTLGNNTLGQATLGEKTQSGLGELILLACS